MKAFIFSHLIIPLALLTIGIACIYFWDLDPRIADLLFGWEGHEWVLKHHWLTETVLHAGGRLLAGTMLVVLILSLVFSFRLAEWRRYRAGLVYLATAILISFLLINGLKSVSGAPCPWSVERYGGDRTLQSWLLGMTGKHGCFPAGHASGGYVWVALYFFALVHRSDHRYRVLAFALGLGFTFGVAQQLRGAHFLSHDLITLGICWFSSLVGFLLWSQMRAGTEFMVPEKIRTARVAKGLRQRGWGKELSAKKTSLDHPFTQART